MLENISGLSIIGMVITLCISVGAPIIVLILYKRKTQGKLINVAIGAGTFIVFALILEPILHLIMQSIFGEKLTGNIWFFAIYGGLAAGLFEETGRLLSMKIFMKKSLSKENSIMYGIGHGGVESVILIGLTYVSNIVTAIMINAGMLDATLASLEESLRVQTIEQLSALWLTPSWQFYIAGIERVLALGLQICLSFIVYKGVKENKVYFYLLAVIIHFLVDAGLILLSQIIPVYGVELALLAVVLCLVIWTRISYKKE